MKSRNQSMVDKVLFSATIDGHIRVFHEPYLKWFKEKGFEVHVAAKGNQEIKYCDKRHQIEFNRSPLSFSNFKAFLQLKKLIKNEKFKIIHCHTPTASVITRLAAIAERKNGTKVFYTAHGFHFFKGAPKKNWLVFYPIEKALARFTDVIITINKEDFEIAKRRFGKLTKVEFCNGVGVDLTRFRPLSNEEKNKQRQDLGYKIDEFLMVYPGEFSKRKNQKMLLRMLVHLKGKLDSFKLLLAGRGNWETMKEEAKQLNIDENIDFLGFRYDIDKFVQIADVAVSSSYHEGLPINIIEALACGNPVVATNVRGNNDLIGSGKNGFLVNTDDDISMAGFVFQLATNKTLYDEMSQNAFKKARDYSVVNTLKTMEEIYNSYI